MVDDKMRIICKKCGKLKREQSFSAYCHARICNECFEPPTEPTTDLVKHVQGLYERHKAPAQPQKGGSP